jgi:murein DD-endopeptidase MepM/ murein hydrolase activator NlpD
VVRTIASLVVLWATALVFVLVVMGRVSLRLHMVEGLEKERARMEGENRTLTTALAKAHSLRKVSDYLGRLAELTTGTSGSDSIRRVVAEAVAAPDTTAEPRAAREALAGLGTAAAQPAASDFVASVPSIGPVDGWMTRRFSAAAGAGGHAGIDIAAAAGTPIRAPAPGVVQAVSHDAYLGLVVEVAHGYGFATRYAHCAQALVSSGQRVVRGQTLALVGSTGRSSAPHLHYEVLRDGVAQDPAKYIWGAGAE